MARSEINYEQHRPNRRRNIWIVVAFAIAAVTAGLIIMILLVTDTVGNGKESTSVSKKSSNTLQGTTMPIVAPILRSTVAPTNAKPKQTLTPTSKPSTVSPSLPLPPVVVAASTPTKSESIPTIVLPPDDTVDVISRCNNGTYCSRRVNELLFATVHNAANTRADGIEFYYNHERNLTEALNAGYRGINVDIGICDGALQLVHAYCVLGYSNLTNSLGAIAAFLQENEREVLLMPTQLDFETGGEFSLLELEAAMPAEFTDLLYQHPGQDVPWPTLQELIDTNQRILFFHYNGERCTSNATCPYGFMNWFDYAAESRFSFENALAFDDKSSACGITRGETSSGFYGVNVFTSIANADQAICSILNGADFLRKHLAACADITQRQVNLVFVDCWDKGDVLAVVHEYNAEL